MIVVDIETHGQAAALAAPYPEAERQPPGNYKNADAIEGWRVKDRAEWKAVRAKECALSPRLGRVVALGVSMGGQKVVNVVLPESDEKLLIEAAMTFVSQAHANCPLVTFNGLSFDLPFLHVRAIATGVRIPYRAGEYLARYRSAPHADLRAILTNWDPKTSGTLSDWCAAFGIQCKDTTSGADIGRMVDAGDVDGIRSHCDSDIDLTSQLAARMRTAGLL